MSRCIAAGSVREERRNKSETRRAIKRERLPHSGPRGCRTFSHFCGGSEGNILPRLGAILFGHSRLSVVVVLKNNKKEAAKSSFNGRNFASRPQISPSSRACFSLWPRAREKKKRLSEAKLKQLQTMPCTLRAFFLKI